MCVCERERVCVCERVCMYYIGELVLKGKDGIKINDEAGLGFRV